jgi:hypothetical protein
VIRILIFLFIVSIPLSKIHSQVELCLSGYTIETRIPPAEAAKRIDTHSPYVDYLRSLRLQSHDENVRLFNNNYKRGLGTVYCAVLDQEIGKSDLHQCADAIIRLKADYHYRKAEYDKIAFNFTNGQRVGYSKWKRGYRIEVDGNKTKWVKKKELDSTYQTYWKYLEQIFMYAGTYSLSKELQKVSLKEMNIGDVFIQGAFPGHAVMVVDMAENTITKKKYYLLGQSYMPAQQFQILVNPSDAAISPWYELKEGEITTPEWTFGNDELKRWK